MAVDVTTRTVELKAPAGKTRVIMVGFLDRCNYLVGDYASRDYAFRVADDHNTKRSGPMDDAYYVYDDAGRCIRESTRLAHS